MKDIPLLSSKEQLTSFGIRIARINRWLKQGKLKKSADYFPPGLQGVPLYRTREALALAEIAY